MKNIHVLKTDKSSILSIEDGILILHRRQWRKGTQNIYITSDEEIKDGDWFICQHGFEKKCVGTTIVNNEVYLLDYLGNTDRLIWCKKIILTTDQDLIKDGVQAIDDEFLEWFVKNPSCEFAHLGFTSIIGDLETKRTYKIIIPKEEPKQETLEEFIRKESKSGNESVGITKGTKWQAERMYSDEEVKIIINDIVEKHCSYFSQNIKNSVKLEWFEKFKKK